MFNLFNKNKVRAGKQNNNEDKKPAGAAAANAAASKAKQQAPFAALGKTWAKLNNMDRKQAYTWGAIAVVVLVVLLTLGSAMGSGDSEDFYEFETRGYDLANMPFSSDEAEQYLLASKYPDMQNTQAPGLYSSKDKEERQAEDAADEAAQLESVSSSASEYVPGRYYGGGGSSGPRGTTKVGSLNSASLKSASGSGVSGTFGPSGDFSNFKRQNQATEQGTATGPGDGNARKALFQMAVGSRTAAGVKDDRLLNAKKALMGGNIKGSDAFLSDSGAVDLSKAGGLNLDENAPISSMDPKDFNDALEDAKEEAEDDALEDEEDTWFRDLMRDLAQQAVKDLLSWGLNSVKDSYQEARADRKMEQQIAAQVADKQMNDYNEWLKNGQVGDPPYEQITGDMQVSVDSLKGNNQAQRRAGVKYNADTNTFVNRKTNAEIPVTEDGMVTLSDMGYPEKKINRINRSLRSIGIEESMNNNPAFRAEVAAQKMAIKGSYGTSSSFTQSGQSGERRMMNGFLYEYQNNRWVKVEK